MTIFDDNLMTIFDDNFCWQLLMTIFDRFLEVCSLQKIVRFFESFCDLRLDTWDTDYICYSSEQQYEQLHCDLWIQSDGDSIRNSCDVCVAIRLKKVTQSQPRTKTFLQKVSLGWFSPCLQHCEWLTSVCILGLCGWCLVTRCILAKRLKRLLEKKVAPWRLLDAFFWPGALRLQQA